MTALTAAALVACGGLGFHLAVRRGFRIPDRPETGSPADHALPHRTVLIPTARGRRLAGWHIPPPGGDPAPHVVVMHGWGANAEDMLPLAVPLHGAGYGVLLVAARNHGRSDRDGVSSMPRFAEDMAHAHRWVEDRSEALPGRTALLGHSVGAAAAIMAAARLCRPPAIAALASFRHPETVTRRFLEQRGIPYRPLGWLVCRHVERVIGHRFDRIAPTTVAAELRCPVLLLHGADDATTPPADSAAIAAAVPPGLATLAVIPGVGHDTLDGLDAVMRTVLDFLAAHLPPTGDPACPNPCVAVPST